MTNAASSQTKRDLLPAAVNAAALPGRVESHRLPPQDLLKEALESWERFKKKYFDGADPADHGRYHT